MTKPIPKDVHRVGHVGFCLTDHPVNGITFSLFCGLDEFPERKNTLFSGHIHKGMSSELHRLAAAVSTLEAKLDAKADA